MVAPTLSREHVQCRLVHEEGGSFAQRRFGPVEYREAVGVDVTQ
jgi:hypothetical protein